jgi:hypothetical protein
MEYHADSRTKDYIKDSHSPWGHFRSDKSKIGFGNIEVYVESQILPKRSS